MDFQKVIEKRASIRHFSQRKPTIEKINALIIAANIAPAPGNLYILRYLIIEDPEKIKKISECCQQPFIAKAPYVVIFCSEDKQIKKMYDKRAERYIKHHVGAAVENYLLKATDLGLASCWVGAFSETSLRNLLRIPDSFEIEVVLPTGYEEFKGKTKQRKKYALYNRLFFHAWGNRFHKPFRDVRRSDM